MISATMKDNTVETSDTTINCLSSYPDNPDYRILQSIPLMIIHFVSIKIQLENNK